MSLIEKALYVVAEVAKAARGEYGFWTLVGAGEGQPREASMRTNLSPMMLREMALKSDTVAACVDAIVGYCSRAELKLSHVDPSQKLPTGGRVADLQALLGDPNPNQETFAQLLKKVFRDLAILDQGAIELVRDGRGQIREMWAVDAANLEVVTDKKGKELGYNLRNAEGRVIPGANGKPPTFRPNELIYISVNPRSEAPYGWSKIESVYAIAMIESYALHYISRRFTEGKIPFGILDMGRISKSQLADAIAALKKEQKVDKTRGEVGFGGSQVLMTGSGEGGLKFIPFGNTLRDLEAPALMRELRFRIMACFGVTENELGMAEDVNRSNGFHLSYTFKSRAVLPILNAVSGALTQRLLHEEFGLTNLEFSFTNLDERDDKAQADIDESRIERGVYNVNEVRRRQGMDPVEGGDINFVYTPVGAIPLNRLAELADAQIAQLRGQPKEGEDDDE